MSDEMESFFSLEMVWAARLPEEDVIGRAEADAIIGRMTGLDMSRYDLIAAPNLRGWYLKRRD